MITSDNNIQFVYHLDFILEHERAHVVWIITVIEAYGFELGMIYFNYCTDEYISDLNMRAKGKDYYTDILTFDYSVHGELSGEIFISVDRVKDNAQILNSIFEDELRRVMIHGVLHMIGFNDGSTEQESRMRLEEDKALRSFHVEPK